jgi:hypothetical protein
MPGHMRRLAPAPHVTVVAGLALVCVTPALAATPPKPNTSNANLSIGASRSAVTYGNAVNLLGITDGANAGTRVDLLANPFPFTGSTPTAVSALTGANGKYVIVGVKPLVNTQYVAKAAGLPSPNESGPVTVLVRIRVSAKVSDPTPSMGDSIRFSGTAKPAHDGARVSIQKRSPTGRYVTIARTRLKDDGLGNSRYSRRLRVDRSGTYRVVVAGDVDHIDGISALRKIRVD